MRSLGEERRERIRSQERAEVAAHLHDSVLQTLAMVQRRADDPREVAALARRQERELRSWLSARPESARGESRLASALQDAAEEVESAHGAKVDVVAVGDRELDDRAEALVAAAREAMTNAAKFGGGSPVAVYAEVSDGAAQVFVRDRGPGLRPRRGAGGPPRRAGVHSGADGAPRRQRARDQPARRRHRGGADAVSGPRVVIVDDHGLFRAGVKAELEELVDLAGDAGTVDEAVAEIARTEPDVVLLDVHMPDGGGVEVIRRVAPEHPAVRFLALSASDAAEDVIAVIRAGARGYVTKTISSEELADAVRRVHDGDAVFSPAAGRLRARLVRGHAAARPRPGADAELDQLTPREREVLQHIARGYMYKEIAHDLGISAKTVEAHVSAVLRKLQLSSRHELTRWAAGRGLD